MLNQSIICLTISPHSGSGPDCYGKMTIIILYTYYAYYTHFAADTTSCSDEWRDTYRNQLKMQEVLVKRLVAYIWQMFAVSRLMNAPVVHICFSLDGLVWHCPTQMALYQSKRVPGLNLST